jgi:hypothetical protein
MYFIMFNIKLAVFSYVIKHSLILIDLIHKMEYNINYTNKSLGLLRRILALIQNHP